VFNEIQVRLATISNDRKSSLVHVPGNLTAVRYRDEIIQPHLMHVIDRQRELIQQDNARPHTARALKLVPCMTTTRGQHCSAPPRHILNQISHIVSWYCSPFLLQHLAELIEGLMWRLSLAHTFIQLIPKCAKLAFFTYLLKYGLLIFQ
jgi:hypothetical protein